MSCSPCSQKHKLIEKLMISDNLNYILLDLTCFKNQNYKNLSKLPDYFFSSGFAFFVYLNRFCFDDNRFKEHCLSFYEHQN